MHFLRETLKNSNYYVWLLGGLVSIALLLVVISQIDFQKLPLIINAIVWPVFILAIFILLLEGFFTALRFQLFTPGKPSLQECLDLTSWFIVSLIILPARLGEIAVIILLKNTLKQTTGSSIMNVLTQRFIDILFLCSMSLVFILVNQSYQKDIYLFIFILLIISSLLLSLYKLDKILGIIASFFYFRKTRPNNKLFRILFRMCLQARIWYRFHLNNSIFSKAVLVSTFKWFCNVGGLALLLYSISIPLSNSQLLLSATAYNFLAIIPLQTIGGIGISEAGLTSILMFFGLPLAFSASVSILTRIVLICTPLIFFLLIQSIIFHQKNDTKS